MDHWVGLRKPTELRHSDKGVARISFARSTAQAVRGLRGRAKEGMVERRFGERHPTVRPFFGAVHFVPAADSERDRTRAFGQAG